MYNAFNSMTSRYKISLDGLICLSTNQPINHCLIVTSASQSVILIDPQAIPFYFFDCNEEFMNHNKIWLLKHVSSVFVSFCLVGFFFSLKTHHLPFWWGLSVLFFSFFFLIFIYCFLFSEASCPNLNLTAWKIKPSNVSLDVNKFVPFGDTIEAICILPNNETVIRKYFCVYENFQYKLLGDVFDCPG